MRKAETGEEREERRRERREEARPPSRTVEEEKELKNSSPPSFCGLSRQKESLLMASIADKNDSLSAERGRKRTGTRGCDEREKHIQERGRSIFGKMCFCTPFGVPLRKSFDPLSFSLSSFFLHSYKKNRSTPSSTRPRRGRSTATASPSSARRRALARRRRRRSRERTRGKTPGFFLSKTI